MSGGTVHFATAEINAAVTRSANSAECFHNFTPSNASVE